MYRSMLYPAVLTQFIIVVVIVAPITREKGYSMQRKYAPWIGGSLIGSFETYHKTLKITRQEYDENPDMVLNTKCF